MDLMPLSAVIFYSIPEEIILFSFGMTIVGEYIYFKKILIASVIAAFASMLIRACVPFGLFSIIGIVVIFIFFWKYLDLSPLKAIIASVFSVSILILLETFTLPIIYKTQNLTLVELWKDNVKRIILAYPNLCIYALITWFLYSRKIFLVHGLRIGSRKTSYNNTHLLITLIILSQGVILSLINQHLDYLGKHLLIVKLSYLAFFIGSIVFLKRIFSGKKLEKTLPDRI